jgi:hypothetical protein
MTPSFIRNIRNPFRREVSQPPTPAIATFTHGANSKRTAANRARNKQARRSRKINR